MKRLTHTLSLACLLSLCPAQAQVSIHIDLGLPVAPRLVLVQPGIQVVEGFQDEVFFHQGWYWCRRPNGWYRSRSPKARFTMIEAHRVPHSLVQVPMGHYRNWHHGEARHNERREEGRPYMQPQHERRDDRKADREREKHERKQEKKQDKFRDKHGDEGERGHR